MEELVIYQIFKKMGLCICVWRYLYEFPIHAICHDKHVSLATVLCSFCSWVIMLMLAVPGLVGSSSDNYPDLPPTCGHAFCCSIVGMQVVGLCLVLLAAALYYDVL
jgi:hypothetical protein